jgi:predicted nucleotidyltransferase
MQASAAITLPDCLPDAIRRLVRELNPSQIILFGSWARGDARPDSDLDLLIVMPEVENKRETAIQALRALSDLPVSKDVVVTTPWEIKARGDEIGLILRPALREGVVVYEHE